MADRPTPRIAPASSGENESPPTRQNPTGKHAAKTQPTTVPQTRVDRAGNFFTAIMSKSTRRGKSMNGANVKDSLIAFCKFSNVFYRQR